MATARYLAELESKKKGSTAQLLFKAARLVNERAVARIREETGQTAIRATHTALLPHLDFAGVRLTDLALRLEISKQATFQLVEEMEALGLVERQGDPNDGRAKLIRFSKKGERALLHGLDVLGEIERELARAVGARRFVELHRALSSLVPILERGGSAPLVSRAKSGAPPRTSGHAGPARARR
ncbi:MAG: MarR family transcriptional regulator [Polyangiaceae bacterium]